MTNCYSKFVLNILEFSACQSWQDSAKWYYYVQNGNEVGNISFAMSWPLLFYS